jgi:hypothetical protein
MQLRLATGKADATPKSYTLPKKGAFRFLYAQFLQASDADCPSEPIWSAKKSS